MKKERTIKASSIKNKDDWKKAMESGARIVFDGGYPVPSNRAAKSKKK